MIAALVLCLSPKIYDFLETTLGGVRDYYVLVLDSERFKRAIDNIDRIRKVETEHISEIWIPFSKNLTYRTQWNSSSNPPGLHS